MDHSEALDPQTARRVEEEARDEAECDCHPEAWRFGEAGLALKACCPVHDPIEARADG